MKQHHVLANLACVNLEEFAALIRKMCEVFQWSQETLAVNAGLNVRDCASASRTPSRRVSTRTLIPQPTRLSNVLL